MTFPSVEHGSRLPSRVLGLERSAVGREEWTGFAAGKMVGVDFQVGSTIGLHRSQDASTKVGPFGSVVHCGRLAEGLVVSSEHSMRHMVSVERRESKTRSPTRLLQAPISRIGESTA